MADQGERAADEDAPEHGAVTGRTLLAAAARSVAAASGLEETVVDVVHGRALRHYREALRQYLALRLADVDGAEQALDELHGVVAATGVEELLQPPGIRARLYRLAREIAGRRRDGAPTGEARARLPWRQPAPHEGLDTDALERLRRELPEPQAEVLELRHARQLEVEEVAHVLDVSPQDVERRVSEGENRAGESIGGSAAQGLPSLLLEAFALAPRKTQPATDVSEHWEPVAEGSVIGGRYEIERRVGSGAFGDVYRAQDTEVPGHVVALKLLHQTSRSDDAKRAALRELHLIASVFHPSIVQFKDHGWHEGRLWFVMPWYEGETLESRIQRRPLSRQEARRIFEPLARALATMHAMGIRHQDVKPENIFLARIRGFGREEDDEEVLPVLIDLGVAAKEAEMVIAGTPEYLAPEVAAQFAMNPDRARPITAASDVFALALALRNALEPETQQDVAGGAVEAFVARRAEEPPAPPSSRELRFLAPWFRRWLALDPAERPTADELAEHLSVLTRPEERRRRVISVVRWAAPIAVTVLAVFASVVYVLNARAERERLEAERAKSAASDLRDDLRMTRQQRERLASDVQELRGEYEKSKLTRRDLVDQLAETKGELKMMRRRFAASVNRREQLEDDLEDTRGRLTKANGQIASLRQDLSKNEEQLKSARTRADELENQLGDTRERLADEKKAAEEANAKVGELDERVTRLRSELDAAKERAKELERQRDRARRERQRSDDQLDRARRRVRELESRVERLRKRPPRPDERGGAGGGDRESGAGASSEGQQEEDAASDDP